MITVVRATAKGKLFSIANIKKQTSYKWHLLLFLLSVRLEMNIFKDINSTTVMGFFKLMDTRGGSTILVTLLSLCVGLSEGLYLEKVYYIHV